MQILYKLQLIHVTLKMTKQDTTHVRLITHNNHNIVTIQVIVIIIIIVTIKVGTTTLTIHETITLTTPTLEIRITTTTLTTSSRIGTRRDNNRRSGIKRWLLSIVVQKNRWK